MPDYKAHMHDWYEKQNVVPPSVTPHGTEESIANNLTPMKINRWRMEGNMLIGESEAGTFAHTVPTTHICHGIDESGKPILKPVVMS